MSHKRDGPASLGTSAEPEAIGKDLLDLLPPFDYRRKQAPQSPDFLRVELHQIPSQDPTSISADGNVAANAPARPVFAVTFRALAGVDGVKALRRTLKYALRTCRLQALDAQEIRDRRR